MNTIIRKLVLKIYNSAFSSDVKLSDVNSIRTLAREGVHFGEENVDSIKLIVNERLDINAEDVATIRLVTNAQVHFGGDDVESIKRLIRAKLQIGDDDIVSVQLLQSKGLRIQQRDIECIRLVTEELSAENMDCVKALFRADSIVAKNVNIGLLRALEQVAVLNRLDELEDIGEGTQLCYSQEGESLILDRYFNFRSEGLYVDVGAHHPKRFSNTYSFYKRGWRGINIDPTPGVKEMFDKVRPEDVTLSVAVSNTEGRHDFYLFNEPALNTFSQSLADEYQRAGYKLLEVRPIESRKLSSLLAESRIEKHIDFMSIDVEDHELQVLESNDWAKFRPSVLLVEILNFDLHRADAYPVHKYILDQGYELFAKTYNTAFYKDTKQ